MIAVFTRCERDFIEMNATPRSNFKRIRSESDIRGVRFTGVIMYFDWYKNKDLIEPYDYLRGKFPELFK